MGQIFSKESAIAHISLFKDMMYVHCFKLFIVKCFKIHNKPEEDEEFSAYPKHYNFQNTMTLRLLNDTTIDPNVLFQLLL
jgi:hypothetical protein